MERRPSHHPTPPRSRYGPRRQRRPSASGRPAPPQRRRPSSALLATHSAILSGLVLRPRMTPSATGHRLRPVATPGRTRSRRRPRPTLGGATLHLPMLHPGPPRERRLLLGSRGPPRSPMRAWRPAGGGRPLPRTSRSRALRPRRVPPGTVPQRPPGDPGPQSAGSVRHPRPPADPRPLRPVTRRNRRRRLPRGQRPKGRTGARHGSIPPAGARSPHRTPPRGGLSDPPGGRTLRRRRPSTARRARQRPRPRPGRSRRTPRPGDLSTPPTPSPRAATSTARDPRPSRPARCDPPTRSTGTPQGTRSATSTPRFSGLGRRPRGIRWSSRVPRDRFGVRCRDPRCGRRDPATVVTVRMAGPGGGSPGRPLPRRARHRPGRRGGGSGWWPSC